MPANSPATRNSLTRRLPDSQKVTTGRQAPIVTSPACDTEGSLYNAINVLHECSGVYTTPQVAAQILDGVGWSPDSDLSTARLLEPAAGEGEFVAQAAGRLVESCRRRGAEPRIEHLRDSIVAYEFHPNAAQAARQRVVRSLIDLDLPWQTAAACAKAWISADDFLLSESSEDRFTHVVGNPPYLRWSKVPHRLRQAYERRIGRDIARGDLYLPFLDKALRQLRPRGTCGFLCSDRWQHAAYAAKFREKWSSRLRIISNARIDAAKAYTRKENSYPTILLASKRAKDAPRSAGTSGGAGA